MTFAELIHRRLIPEIILDVNNSRLSKHLFNTIVCHESRTNEAISIAETCNKKNDIYGIGDYKYQLFENKAESKKDAMEENKNLFDIISVSCCANLRRCSIIYSYKKEEFVSLAILRNTSLILPEIK